MRLTFLGTGTSFGVPQVGCGCAVCRSDDPRDRRTRSGALLRAGGATLLLDSPPELRLQLVGQGVTEVCRGALHPRARRSHGGHRRPPDLHGPEASATCRSTARRRRSAQLESTYRYIFDPGVTAYEGTSKPHLEPHALEPGVPMTVAGVEVLPLAFPHGHLRVYGYRFGKLAYLTDVKDVGTVERAALQGVEVLVLNALWWRPHPTHLSIDEAVALARELGAARTYLTHLTHETGHAELAARLPGGRRRRPTTD